MTIQNLQRIPAWLYNAIISVPVRLKITGIILMTVLTLGLTLNYWVTTSLADWLSYLLTDVRVEAAMRAGNRSVILITVLAAAGSLVIASFLTFVLTRPLIHLRDMARKVAGGDLHARAPVWSKDEIGEVAIAINQMTDHLVDTQNDLARTNRRLAAINQVMLAAERESEIQDALFAILNNLVSIMNLETGWVYLRDPERNLFHLASWINVPDGLKPCLLHESREAGCACQRDLIAGKLPEEAAVLPCERYQHDDRPTTAHHITIPIAARGQQYGVVNLLCPQDNRLSADNQSLLTDIGAQISEIVANAWLRLKLTEKEMARQALLESLVEAQEEERARLARELHDGAGQMLTSLLVNIKMLERQTTSPELHHGLTALLDMVSETIEQVRDLSYGLRPATLEEFGLPVALQTLAEEMAAESGLQATCHLEADDLLLPPGIDVMLYRIAQECLTNVVRHAQAEHVLIELVADNQAVTLRIEDDGRGFDPHQLTAVPGQRHLGLISMQERAAMASGALNVYTAPGQGTAVVVRIPLLELA